MPGDKLIAKILEGAVERAGVTHLGADYHFPLIVRSGTNAQNTGLHYLLNYSAATLGLTYPFGAGIDLLSGKAISEGGWIELKSWGVAIVEDSPAH